MWLNYGEVYCVSEDGEIKNRITGEWLMPCYDYQGRLIVNIYGYPTKVHRIVADRFCPKTRDDLEVDHINREPSDNRAANLRWVDRSTNNRNRNSSNITKDHNGYRVQIRARGKYIYYKWFKTLAEAIAARDAFKLTDEFRLL
jgi:hypothetical protein